MFVVFPLFKCVEFGCQHASVPEWSKGVDSSSTVCNVRVGSNPTACKPILSSIHSFSPLDPHIVFPSCTCLPQWHSFLFLTCVQLHTNFKARTSRGTNVRRSHHVDMLLVNVIGIDSGSGIQEMLHSSSLHTRISYIT